MEDKSIIRRVRDEHERLREITNTLVKAARLPSSEPAEKWLANLRKCFEHFRAHLVKRIALEEMGGFLNVVVQRRPTLAHEVENLRKDHADMVERAGHTLANLNECRTFDDASLKQAALLVNMALAEVRYQEEAETLLVSFVFTQETGGGD